LKILQINASYKPAYIYGGPTMSVAKLSEQLVKTGCRVAVFTTTANGTLELPVVPNIKTFIDGIEVTYFKRLTKDHTHFSPKLLFTLWKEVPGFDLVHIHAWWNLVSVLSALITFIKKKPVLISPRGTLSPYSFNNKNNLAKKLLHNLLGKRLLSRSYLHATSVAEHKALESLVAPIHIFDIPNFVKIALTQSTNTTLEQPVLKLLFFSRIEEKKGLNILLEALPLINVPYHLTIAGDGDKVYIDKLKSITQNNLSSINVSWIGFQNETKFTIFGDHQLLILPSYDENFGNVVIESLSVGTPVLISGNVGLADYIEKNNFGWICETNPESVGNAINTITSTYIDQLAQIRDMAPAVIHHDFNDDLLIQKYIAMYRQIINHD
jgi:glycosyltransferase involved in cell wall biosynthesis